jgi:hypothetical protein
MQGMRVAAARQVLFCSLAVLVHTGASAAEDGLAERFSREYPEAAQRLVTAYAHVKGRIRLTKQPALGPERLYTGTFSADHGMWKMDLIREGAGGPAATMVSCSGGDTEFLVARNDATSGYFIVDARRHDSTAIRAEAYEELRYFYTAAFAVVGWPFLEIIQAPGFRVLSVAPANVSDNECAEVNYTADGSRLGHRGTVWLDPNQGWVIRRAAVEGGDGTWDESPLRHVEINIEYPLRADLSPIPASTTMTGPGLNARVEFSDCRFEATPRDEFLLEHYGLSETNWDFSPEGETQNDNLAAPPEAPRSRLLWMNVLLIPLSIAAAAFVWWTRRQRKG